MKPIGLFLTMLSLFSPLYSQVFELKDGTRHGLIEHTVTDGILHGRTQGNIEIRFAILEVERAWWSKPKALLEAEEFMAAGKPDEALIKLNALIPLFANWDQIPGYWGREIAILRIEALAQSENLGEFEAALISWEKAQKGPEVEVRLEVWRLRLAVLKKEPEVVKALCLKLTSRTEGAGNISFVAITLAQLAFSEGRYEDALNGFLLLAVSTGEARRYVASAELGAARCLIKLGRETEAVIALERVITDFPQAPEFALAKVELQLFAERAQKQKTNHIFRLPPP